MPDLVLAIDVGSSWCKAAYIDKDGKFVAEGRAYTRNIVPARHTLLAQFWESVVTAVRAAGDRLPASGQPAAIALTCRALFGICIDHAGQPFFPAHDAATRKSSPEYQHAYSAEVWGDKDPYAFGYGIAQAAIALWLRRARPDDWRCIARIGALHDFIVYAMTDQWVTDPTSGPGPTGWPREIIEMSGLPPEAFPPTLEPQVVAGGLTSQAADALGLPQGTPVVVGSHDGAAANLGVRAIYAGDACLTLGTNFVFRASSGARLTTGCFQYVVAPGSWAWVNNVPSSSTQLDIVAEMLRRQDADLWESHRLLGALADEVAPGADGLSIERILPGNEEMLRAQVRSAQQAGYTDGPIYRAMLEAIAFGVRDLVSVAMRCGIVPKRYVATGGSANNRAFLQVLAAVLNTPIEIGQAEAGLTGAAIGAALASNWYPTLRQAMEAMTPQYPVVEPDTHAIDYYASTVGRKYHGE